MTVTKFGKSGLSSLNFRDFLSLKLQQKFTHVLSLLTYFLVLGWMRFGMGYRIKDIQKSRQQFKELTKTHKGPFLICPNHLTMVDSVLIIWALASAWRYFLHFSLFAWNLPERRHASNDPLRQVVCYLGKCITIVRQGPAEQTKRSLAKINYLLEHGDSVMIFPEGTRSRSGKVDTQNFAYGVGKLVQDIPNLKVLCVYFRGKSQAIYSNFPKRNEEFTISIEPITPHSDFQGLRGTRDIATQIIGKLSAMENQYFNANGIPAELPSR